MGTRRPVFSITNRFGLLVFRRQVVSHANSPSGDVGRPRIDEEEVAMDDVSDTAGLGDPFGCDPSAMGVDFDPDNAGSFGPRSPN